MRNRLLLAGAAALLVLSASCDSSEGFGRLNARAAKEYLEPVRPGVPGGQPFWNVYSNKFTILDQIDLIFLCFRQFTLNLRNSYTETNQRLRNIPYNQFLLSITLLSN